MILPKVTDTIMQYIPVLLEITGQLAGAVGSAIINNLPQIIDGIFNAILKSFLRVFLPFSLHISENRLHFLGYPDKLVLYGNSFSRITIDAATTGKFFQHCRDSSEEDRL